MKALQQKIKELIDIEKQNLISIKEGLLKHVCEARIEALEEVLGLMDLKNKECDRTPGVSEAYYTYTMDFSPISDSCSSHWVGSEGLYAAFHKNNESDDSRMQRMLRMYTDEQLENSLKESIAEEDYLVSAKIRDEIERRANKGN